MKKEHIFTQSYRWLTIAIVTLAIATALAALSAVSASAQAPASNETIVFQTSSGGPIYAVNPDGSGLRYLTDGIDPALSPDGTQLAFTRWGSGEIGAVWLYNMTTGEERHLLGEMYEPKSPSWSPDGTQLVISHQDGGRRDAVRTCTMNRRQIPPGATNINIGSETGRICYTLNPDTYWQLRQIDLATGDFEDLPAERYAYSPSWNPAQDWHIVYDGDLGLVNLDINQGKSWPLTATPDDHSPVISPDGSQIALTHKQVNSWDIHTIDPAGSNRVKLTETPYYLLIQQQILGQPAAAANNVSPAWSPDGNQIAFLTDRDGRWEIWLMNADGSNQHSLLPDSAYDEFELSYNFVDERVLSWQ